MAKKVTGEDNDLIVLARAGHGQDWKEIYHANKADNTKPGMEKKSSMTAEAATALCIAYIKDHRAAGNGMDYRIKDLVSGAIID
jgi:hypothetical protein